MIIKNIVFIIGAGGSIPYGFPSGEMLVNDIIRLTNSEFNKDFLNHIGVDIMHVRNFGKILKQSKTPSIDIFLANQNELNRKLGKYFIADIIGRQIMPQPHCNETDDWYKIIYQKMLTNFDNIGNNKVSFITFNYDTSLENYLYNAFKSFFNNQSIEELNSMMRKVNFIHVYGSIDLPPWEKEEPESHLLNSKSSFKEIELLSDRIKIIDEGSFSDKELNTANQILSKANSIYITGFSYNHINIELIGLNKKELCKNKVIIGNSYGLGKAERTDAGEILMNSNILIGENNLRNKQFIKEYVNFI